jgi:hypothetical protein
MNRDTKPTRMRSPAFRGTSTCGARAASDGHARATIRAYHLPRFLSLAGAASWGVLPNAGVIAGCAAATTWAKLGVIAGIDHAIASALAAFPFQVRVYIDDFEVSARGPTSRHVVGTLASYDQFGSLVLERSAERHFARGRFCDDPSSFSSTP